MEKTDLGRACRKARQYAVGAMRRSVLIVEDEPRIAHWLQVRFEREGYRAEVAHDGRTGLALARAGRPDLIVLDLMLPRLDGMQVCRILRRESGVPIIMLTARETHEDRIAGLDSGADDYVVKPFDADEVVARAKAVLRRVEDTVQQVLTCGGITIDETTHRVTVEGREIELSSAQFALLAAFMRHPHQVLSRDRLIGLAFGTDFDGYERAVDNHIMRLRKELGAASRQPIQTVYGAGYRFVPEQA